MRWGSVGSVLAACLLSSCSVVSPPSADDVPPQPGPQPGQPSGPQAREQGLRVLGGLRVADRAQPEDYDRDAFGSAWADTDGNGCNQRDDVLLRDAVPGTVSVAAQGGCDHDVLAGTWVDPYTGATLVLDDLKDLSQAQAVQIDHAVPLAEAWASGADGWSEEERRTYANDLRNLLAADGPTNASKGDDDPAAWRPRTSFQCAYAVRWVRVKARYDLAADPSESRALGEMLQRC